MTYVKTNDVFETWSWMDQESWCCTCSTGHSQSPINLEAETSLSRPNNKIIPRYRPINDIYLVYNGNEIEVYGRFGSFEYKNELGNRIFKAYKITFKFPGEHTIEGKAFEGEMKIHHRSYDGIRAVFSCMFDICEANEEKFQNHFIEAMKPREWKLIPNERFLMKGRFDVNDFFADKLKNKFKNPSYFHYVGSLSHPPCTENIERFVLGFRTHMPEPQYWELRNNSYDSNSEPNGNARRAHPNDDIIVYKHNAKEANCEEKKEDVIPPSEGGKFIKLVHTQHEYAILGDKLNFNDLISDNLALHYIHENQVPEDIKLRLKTTYYNDLRKNISKYTNETYLKKNDKNEFDNYASKDRMVTEGGVRTVLDTIE